ncbi:MAG TPA: class I SAM-dependent methyltransferase [Acidimicrobiia bacterium]|nr:class I SAM-dependent methyltransferase [Acidimicrobiia bacterium]
MLDAQLLDVARAAKGFMPDDEGAALHDAALAAARRVGAPLLEVGTYCGKSAVYLGAAAREAGTVLFTVDHHRGSEENQAGWEHHDREVVDSRTGRMDTLPFFRRTMEAAGLEQHVVGVVGHSGPIATVWATPLAFVFVDGGHSEAIAMADYEGWARHLGAGGILAIHDVFERPEDGGRGPFQVWQRAVADGLKPVGVTGSLRTLERTE